jgi:hypothetical protein
MHGSEPDLEAFSATYHARKMGGLPPDLAATTPMKVRTNPYICVPEVDEWDATAP